MKASFSLPALALAIGLASTLAGCAQPTSAQTTESSQPSQQAPMTAPHHRHHRTLMQQALSQLQLTPDERQKIVALRQDFRAHEQGVTDPAQRRADAKQLRANVLAVLTPDQLAQFKATMKSLRAQQRAAREAMPGSQPMPGSGQPMPAASANP